MLCPVAHSPGCTMISKYSLLSATLRCEAEKKFLASTKRDPVFIFKVNTYRREGPKVLKKHHKSDSHCEAIDTSTVLPQWMIDVSELKCNEH